MNLDRSKTDRRGTDRFPIEREVRYKVLNKKNADEAGNGKAMEVRGDT